MESDSKPNSNIKLSLKSIGKIIDAHGIKGEFKIKFSSSETDWIESLNDLYINQTQYEILSLRPNKTFWILKLKDINDRNESEKFKGEDLLADQSLFQTADDEDPYLSELMGFDVELENIVKGQIVGFKETSAHFLLVLRTSEGCFEIPYVDDFIVEILRPERKIKMSFPEDLLSHDYKVDDVF